ncbi:MAG: hypothetical protein LBI03_10580 [Clostridiales bacterium]|jgi:hypothetical protein|nr:hypothetical protein [Clostridiales bacterium]
MEQSDKYLKIIIFTAVLSLVFMFTFSACSGKRPNVSSSNEALHVSRTIPIPENTSPIDLALVKSGNVNYGDFVYMDGIRNVLAFVPMDSIMTHKANYDDFSFSLNEESEIKNEITTNSINAVAPSEDEIRSVALYDYEVIIKVDNQFTPEDSIRSSARILGVSQLYYLDYNGSPAFSLLP